MRKLHRALCALGLACAVLLSVTACTKVAPNKGDVAVLASQAFSPETSAATAPITPTGTEPQQTEPPETEPSETEPPETEPPAPTEPPPELNASGAFVWDLTDRTLVFSKGDLDARRYPASITKLFTSYVALQYLAPDAIITVGEELSLVRPLSSVAFLERGYQISVEMLIQGMIMPSGNDAAQIIATAAGRAAAGNPDLPPAEAVAFFVEKMNAHARRLGLLNTHFTSPDGYHDPLHYTTLRGIIRIAELAMEEPIIRKYAAAPTTTVTVSSGQQLWWHNTNMLIDPNTDYFCPAAVGLKTGYTGEAGWCLVGAFQTGGRTLIIGVFGCEDNHTRMTDALNLYDYAIQQ